MKRVAILFLSLAACTASRTPPADGSVDDGGGDACVRPYCPVAPTGCHYVPDGSSCSCGTLVCADGGTCLGVDCIGVPMGCTYVDDGTCCGTYSCPPDAGTDAGCPLPPCAAPPPGCTYEGAGCGTCGTIVCPDAGPMADCRTAGCPSGYTCRPCGVPGPGGVPYSCVPDGVVCGL